MRRKRLKITVEVVNEDGTPCSLNREPSLMQFFQMLSEADVVKESKPPNVLPEHSFEFSSDLYYDLDHDYGSVPENLILGALLLVHLSAAKGYGYGPSWRSKGEIRGVAANIDRKYDRLSKAWENLEKGKDAGARFDSTPDLALYALLYQFIFLLEKEPNLFRKWMETDVAPFLESYYRTPDLIKANEIEPKVYAPKAPRTSP